MIHTASLFHWLLRLSILSAVLLSLGCGQPAGWSTPRHWLDAWSLRFENDPALTANYVWPAGIEFNAPIDLPHINNYPAFARIGARGTAQWKDGQLTAVLTEITHARERNVWFDCRDIKQVRVGLTSDNHYTERLANSQSEQWSAWQAMDVQRPALHQLIVRGTWRFLIDVRKNARPWEQRLVVEARCTTRDNTVFIHRHSSSAWFLAKAAHQQARAPDPCAQTFSLQNALAAKCMPSLLTRLQSPWGRREASSPPTTEASWLDVAVTEGVPDAIRPLVKSGVDVNSTSGERRDTALIYAAGNGDAAIVRELIQLGARIDQADAVGFTAYNAAALSGHGDLALELASRGVERNINTGNAYTALSLAAYYDQQGTVRRLLESGSDPDTQVNGWYNALHHAVKKDNVELARLLLAGGANPNMAVTARRGETPLMMAAENNNLEMIDLLRRMGAQLHTIDTMGKNATDYAEFFRKARASNYLCKLGLEPTGLDPSPKNGETAKRYSCQQLTVGR
jgi:ankyrin repeat protein